jgi:hypothetical protein
MVSLLDPAIALSTPQPVGTSELSRRSRVITSGATCRAPLILSEKREENPSCARQSLLVSLLRLRCGPR